MIFITNSSNNLKSSLDRFIGNKKKQKELKINI